MTETEQDYVPGHPETLDLEQGDLASDDNPRPGESEQEG